MKGKNRFSIYLCYLRENMKQIFKKVISRIRIVRNKTTVEISNEDNEATTFKITISISKKKSDE